MNVSREEEEEEEEFVLGFKKHAVTFSSHTVTTAGTHSLRIGGGVFLALAGRPIP